MFTFDPKSAVAVRESGRLTKAGGDVLKVYGHPASQPSRSVIWACVLNELPFRLIAPNPNEETSISLRGQLPVIDDAGFVLTEMPAILSYLAEKHRWDAMYPEDIRPRARIAEYLHAHHGLTRLATTKLMAPHVLVAFGENPTSNPLSYINNICIQASMDDQDGLATGQRLLAQVIEFLEQAYLDNHDFIAGTSHATIADLACYEEIWQLEEANLLDLSGRERMQGWLRRMTELPGHADVHSYNRVLGDIRLTPNTMERFSDAVNQAFSSLSRLKYVHVA